MTDHRSADNQVNFSVSALRSTARRSALAFVDWWAVGAYRTRGLGRGRQVGPGAGLARAFAATRPHAGGRRVGWKASACTLQLRVFRGPVGLKATFGVSLAGAPARPPGSATEK